MIYNIAILCKLCYTSRVTIRGHTKCKKNGIITIILKKQLLGGTIMNAELLRAREELGAENFEKHLRTVFGITCLDFVETIVINLPGPCYADCEYCIDKDLRRHCTNSKTFLEVCEKVLQEFPKAKNVSITGGSLNHVDFNKMLDMIKQYLPESFVIWNTNGIGLNVNYASGISKINCVNLHRHSLDEEKNRKPFRATREIISIDEAKELLGKKLFLRVTIDETFDLDEFVTAQTPLYLNRLLPGTPETNANFKKTMQKLQIENVERKRRNVYIDCIYREVPVRICVGDTVAECVPDRKPTYLNVAIIHRSGIVCGSWYENDKVIFNHNNN